MRGTVAKRLRRQVYGATGSTRLRVYTTFRFNVRNKDGKVGSDGKVLMEPRVQLIADEKRQAYQTAKHAWSGR